MMEKTVFILMMSFQSALLISSLKYFLSASIEVRVTCRETPKNLTSPLFHTTLFTPFTTSFQISPSGYRSFAGKSGCIQPV